MEWLFYHQILNPPYNFTASEILLHVMNGRLLFFDRIEPHILPTDQTVFRNRSDRDRLDHLALQAYRICTVKGECDRTSETQIAKLLQRADPRLLESILPGSLFLKSQVDSLKDVSVPEAQDRKPTQAKETFRAYALGVINKANEANIKLPTRADLAEQILSAFRDTKNPNTGKPYDVRTVIGWIRELFPNFSPLKPGAKKKN